MQKEKDEAEIISFEVCPKCGKEHPRLTKGGKTKGGKQMLRCFDCGRRFVIDHNEITFYSRLSKEQWNEGIKCSLAEYSIDATAKKCDVTHRTAFNMRHKVMSFMEKKEKQSQRIKCRQKKLRLLTATQRRGGSSLRSYNLCRPSSDEVMNLAPHIQEGVYHYSSYTKLTEKLGSKRVIVSSHKDYDKVNHLSAMHSPAVIFPPEKGHVRSHFYCKGEVGGIHCSLSFHLGK